ncbi:MAG: hypothetical protein NT079_06200 [Candidatus Omnitrophica bacterium]|nr:hypothetical protein [Candidatus Omnitrophota bacterium]
MKKRFAIFLLLFLGILLVGQGQTIFAQETNAKIQAEDDLKAKCSSDADCSRPGMLGVCQAPGEKTARCVWQEVIKVPAIVIEPEACRSCQANVIVDQLRTLFSGLEVEYLKTNDKKARDLIQEFKIKMLPAYILEKDVEREPGFANFQKMATLTNGKYYLNPERSGVSFFVDRKLEKDKLDLFLVLTSPGMYQSAKIAQEIAANKKANVAVNIHFLGIEDPQSKKIVSPGEDREISEDTIYACVEKYYPSEALGYLTDRILNISDIWLEDYLAAHKLDAKKIKGCALSQEGQKLFMDKIRLSQELNVRYAPLFLMENNEIFGASEKTTADEIIKIMKSQNATK